MHTIFDLLEASEALRILYALGYEPRDENFVELTADQYEALRAQGGGSDGRWYRITRGVFEDRNNPPSELPIVSDPQREALLQAVKIVYDMTAGAEREFNTFSQRLAWLRSRLPAVITGGG
jgi:hypothetical protein